MDKQYDTEEPAIQVSEPETTHIKHAHRFVLGYVFLIILVVAVGWTYRWQHNKVSYLNTKVASLQSQISKSATTTKPTATKKSTVTNSPLIETDTLDNGTTVSYPLTSATANVIWWSMDYVNTSQNPNAAPEGDMVLSDKRIIEYLSLIPSDTLQTICGSDGTFLNNVGIDMNTYNPVNPISGHNQYENCIQSVSGSNTKYAAQAKVVLAESNADINAFETSLKVNAK